MDFRFDDHLYKFDLTSAEQESVPFIGDLYNSQSKEFFPITEKRLFVKTVRVSPDSFFGELVFGSVEWSSAPPEYDCVIVGVEISIPQQGKASEKKGLWALSHDNLQVRTSLTADLRVSPGDVLVHKFILAPLDFFKRLRYSGKYPYIETSFSHCVDNTIEKIEKARSVANELISYNDGRKLQTIKDRLDDYKLQLFHNMLKHFKNLNEYTWVGITLFLLGQSEMVDKYNVIMSKEIEDVEKQYAEKRSLIKRFRESQIPYIINFEVWRKIIDTDEDIYAIFLRQDLILSNIGTMQYFFRLCKENIDDRKTFYALDVDLIPKDKLDISENEIVIRNYSKGRMRNIDPACEKFLSKGNVAKCTGTLTKTPFTKKALLKITCPGHFCHECPSAVEQWTCEKCGGVLFYDYMRNIFCNACGGAKIQDFVFKCKEPEHNEYYPLFNRQLNELDALPALKDLNILVLGQSGVGKSTWINTSMYYMSHDTLEDAAKVELNVPIPTKLTRGDKTFYSGNDENEKLAEAGESATQDCRCYVNMWKEMVINIIDTPGLGDVRGIAEDKKNIKKILDYIRHIDTLHGICILMKSDETRLTPFFKYCLKEILSNLHDSAKRNVVFCFTNARTSFYQPGQTLPIMREMLDEIGLAITKQNLFCVDNEAFQFLCFRDFDSIKFSREEYDSYVKSWDVSSKETHRLFQTVADLHPHKTKESLSLNHSRRKILSLTRPIGDITQIIQMNIESNRALQNEITSSQHNLDWFKQRSQITVFKYKQNDLDHPRTVCTDKGCVTERETGVSKIKTTIYTTHCHTKCRLKHVEVETHPEPGLRRCAAMGGTREICQRCGCSWETHMHITYDQTIEQKLVEDPYFKAKLAKSTDAQDAQRLLMQECERRIKEQEDEKKVILKLAAKYAHFLKQNAIIPYNDSLGDYLRFLITAEQSRVIKTEYDMNKIREMKNTLAQYEMEVDIFKNSAQTGGQVLTLDEIEACEQDLFSLKIHGKQLKDLLSVAMKTEDRAAGHEKIVIPPAKPKKGIMDKIVDTMTNFWSLGGKNDLSGKDKENTKQRPRGGYNMRRNDSNTSFGSSESDNNYRGKSQRGYRGNRGGNKRRGRGRR